MGVSVMRVFHQPGDCSPESRTTVLCDAIFDRLPELQQGLLRGVQLRKVVPVQDHWLPSVAVEVVDSAAGADEQVSFIPQRAETGADLHVEMWVV